MWFSVLLGKVQRSFYSRATLVPLSRSSPFRISSKCTGCPDWLELECLLVVYKLWEVFAFNSPVILCLSLRRFTLCLHTYHSDKDLRRQVSRAFSLQSSLLCRCFTSKLTNTTVFFGGGSSLGHSFESVFRKKPRDLEDSCYLFSFPKKIQSWAVIVKCHAFCLIFQFFILEGKVWSLSFWGKSPTWPLKCHFPHYSVINLIS